MELKNESSTIAANANQKQSIIENQNGAAKNPNSKTVVSPVKNDATAKPADDPKLSAEKAEELLKPEAVIVPDQRPSSASLSLNDKLKVVNELHRKSIQRLNLMSRIKQLEEFEVALAQDNDELADNPYQGCRLIIEDDQRRQFVTTTPGLIRMVAQFIFEACNKKLSEIEATIHFPN